MAVSKARLRRLAPLYRTARLYESDHTLRRYLGVDDDYVIPLSLSHGVDFGQLDPPFEVEMPEPIHWAYNDIIADRAEAFKPVVLIPHPFLLEAGSRVVEPSLDLLIVGPPPSPQNDLALLRSLRNAGVRSGTILIKPRGNVAASAAFWTRQGFDTTSLGSMNTTTYAGMVTALGRFRQVVSPTLSSIVIFAAALGAKVTLLDDCVITSYDLAELEHRIPFESSAPRHFVQTLARGTVRDQQSASLRMLGSEIDSAPEFIREQIDQAIAALAGPLHFPRAYSTAVRWALGNVARITKRPGLVSIPLHVRLKSFRPPIAEVRSNDVDYWLNGRNETNFEVIPVGSPTPIAQPGYGVGWNDEWPEGRVG